jgi:hypothetical protein
LNSARFSSLEKRSHVRHSTERGLPVFNGSPRVRINNGLILPAKSPEAVSTQVLPVLYDVKAAVANCFRALKPGGVLLVTMPSVARTTLEDKDHWGDYWRFTSQSARRLFAEVFPAGGVRVEAKGNMLTAVAFLYGLATPDLTPQELEYNDPCYEFVVTVRAVKPKGG